MGLPYDLMSSPPVIERVGVGRGVQMVADNLLLLLSGGLMRNVQLDICSSKRQT